jgi:hypothetical protein
MELTYGYVSPKRLDCGHLVSEGDKYYLIDTEQKKTI